MKYVAKEFENIKETAPEFVIVDVDVIPAAAGSDLKNVALKLSPKNNNTSTSIVVSSGPGTTDHIEMAGDDSSNVAVMLELARALPNQMAVFKHSVIFQFNPGDENDTLNGAHTFITQQNRWNEKIRLAIDLDGLGLGGNKSAHKGSVSGQASGGLKDPVIILFGNNGDGQEPLKQGIFPAQAKNVKENPLTLQDIFKEDTGSVKYGEVESFSGIDFQELGTSTVYHTRNDKFGPADLKKESIINLGENMLAFLLQVGSTSTIDFDVSST